MKLETVRLSRIDLRDERFRVSPFIDPASLARSIKKFGLRNPPLLRPSGKRFTIVSGWKRVLACRAAGLREIPALVTAEADDLRVFLATVEENLERRTLSLVEKAAVLEKLAALGLGRDRLVGDMLPALALPATASHLRRFLSLARARTDVRKFAHVKDCPASVLEALLRFADGDRTRLLPILYPLGQNKQKEVLDDLWDIGRRDGVSVRRVLAHGAIGETLRSVKLAPVQKADRVRLILRTLRYPSLSSRQAAFDTALRKAGLPRQIVVQPSPAFEDESVSLSFRFRSAEELRRRLRDLEALVSSPELGRLFRE